MAKEVKKENKNNKLFLIIGGVLVIAIVVVSLVLLFGGNKPGKDNKNPGGNEPDQKEKVNKDITEEDMIKAYGMSIKDAEEIVKKDVLSDNFTFSTEISKDYMYIVTVKDTLSTDSFKYEVNPVTKTAVALS